MLLVAVSLLAVMWVHSDCAPCLQVPSTTPVDFPFVMPLDLRVHPEYQYETIWYVGVVHANNGTSSEIQRSFGVEYMVVRTGEPCLDANATNVPGVAWAALADPKTGIFRQQFLLTNVSANIRNASVAFFLEAGSWSIRQLPARNWTQQRLSGSGIDDRRLDTFGYDLLVSIEGRGPNHTQAMGRNGLCRIVDPANTSAPDAVYHMEQPTLVAYGNIVVGGETIAVNGTLWYQHMWGTPTIQPSGNKKMTWDWFYVRLSDGFKFQLVCFNDYKASSYLNFVRPDGNNTFYAYDQFQLLGTDPWVSDNNETYFMTHIILLPAEGLNITVHTLENDNVLRAFSQDAFYEGASRAFGVHRGGNVTGEAFTEHSNV